MTIRSGLNRKPIVAQRIAVENSYESENGLRRVVFEDLDLIPRKRIDCFIMLCLI